MTSLFPFIESFEGIYNNVVKIFKSKSVDKRQEYYQYSRLPDSLTSFLRGLSTWVHIKVW